MAGGWTRGGSRSREDWAFSLRLWEAQEEIEPRDAKSTVSQCPVGAVTISQKLARLTETSTQPRVRHASFWSADSEAVFAPLRPQSSQSKTVLRLEGQCFCHSNRQQNNGRDRQNRSEQLASRIGAAADQPGSARICLLLAFRPARVLFARVLCVCGTQDKVEILLQQNAPRDAEVAERTCCFLSAERCAPSFIKKEEHVQLKRNHWLRENRLALVLSRNCYALLDLYMVLFCASFRKRLANAGDLSGKSA